MGTALLGLGELDRCCLYRVTGSITAFPFLSFLSTSPSSLPTPYPGRSLSYAVRFETFTCDFDFGGVWHAYVQCMHLSVRMSVSVQVPSHSGQSATWDCFPPLLPALLPWKNEGLPLTWEFTVPGLLLRRVLSIAVIPSLDYRHVQPCVTV